MDDSLDIVTVGDPRLNEVTPVDDFALARQGLERLTAKLREIGGAGLAGPQLGIPLAIAAVEVRRTPMFPTRPESGLLWLINPRVVETAESTNDDWEACFSVPEIIGLVPRAASVTVEYADVDSQPRRERYEGYVARVIQHEIDHLNGREYLTRMHDMSTISTQTNFMKRVNQ